MEKIIDEMIAKYTARKERAEKEDESHLYSKGYSRGSIRACVKIIKDLKQLKSSLSNKQIDGIKELIDELENVSSKSINKDFEDGYNGGIRHALELVKEYKSSLPTQQDKVVVPPYVGELICWVQKNNAVPSDVISDFYSLAVDEINLPSTLELEKLSTYFSIACHRFDFEKACIIGYTVENEQLYYVEFGYNRVLVKGKIKLSNGDDHIWIDHETDLLVMEGYKDLTMKFTEQEIKAIDERYWAFAVPVEEDE